jgi:solute carrier family 25 (mitochondrial uncoupling protein), member 27
MKELTLIPIASLFAETITHPVDFIKTQKQYIKTSVPFYTLCLQTFQKNGVRGFYPSIVPAVMRHWVYTTTRVGLYEHLRSKDSNVLNKMYSGVIAGGIAQAIASPTDLIKIKLQTQVLQQAKKCKQIKYVKKDGMYAIIKNVYKTQGFKGFYYGWQPNVMRAMFVNLGELVAYDTGKQYLLQYMNDSIVCHGFASLHSGFWSTLLSTPADVLKTRLMADSKYTMFQCTKDIIKDEGFLSLWKGFFPNWFRLAPWQFVFWITYEQLRKANNLDSFK